MFEEFLPSLGSFISSAFGYAGQKDTNETNQAIADSSNAFNASQAQLNRDYQTEMSNTAYQRQVKDMSAAGLNPMLAYVKGGGASSPSGSTATATTPQYTSPIQAAAHHRLSSAQSAKTEAEVPKVKAETRETESKIPVNEKQVDKMSQEINNLKTEDAKAKQLIDNLREEYQNLYKQGFNLTEVGNHLRKSIDLMSSQITNFGAITDNVYVLTEINKLERQLKGFDVNAAQSLGNFGREYNQIKGLLDVFKALVSIRR